MFKIIQKNMFCSTGIYVFFFFFFELIHVNFKNIKMECKVSYNEYFRHLFLICFFWRFYGCKRCSWHLCCVWIAYYNWNNLSWLVCQDQLWKFGFQRFALYWISSCVRWKAIKSIFACKFTSTNKITGREN